MGGENPTFWGGSRQYSGDLNPKPPTPEDPSVQENKKKAEQAERGQRGRASTMLSSRSMLGDMNVFRRSLLGQ